MVSKFIVLIAIFILLGFPEYMFIVIQGSLKICLMEQIYPCNMALYLFSFNTLLTMVDCLQPDDIGVCYRNSNGNSWLDCCKGYQLLQGKCEKCPPGKYSDYCERDCPDRFYGEGCISKCNCYENEYCDQVFGCLCKNCTNTETITDDLTTQENRLDTDINISLLLYIGIPCAVSFLAMVTFLWIRKRRHNMEEAELNVPQSHNPITEQQYDYIDESILDDICHNDEVSTKHNDVNLFIQSEHSFENSENSSVNSFATDQQSSVCRDGYLIPFCSLQTAIKPVLYDIPIIKVQTT